MMIMSRCAVQGGILELPSEVAQAEGLATVTQRSGATTVGETPQNLSKTASQAPL